MRLKKSRMVVVLSMILAINIFTNNFVVCASEENNDEEVKIEENNIEFEDIENHGHIPIDFSIPVSVQDNIFQDNNELINDNSSLPIKYDSRDYGYITEVKNQGKYDTCWAHSAISLAETDAIIDGRELSPDYSEAQLAWFLYKPVVDPLGGTVGDTVEISDGENYLSRGGDLFGTTMTLAKWISPADESVLRYDNIEYISSVDEKLSYETCVAHLQNSYWIPTCDTKSIKEMIIRYGSVSSSILYYPTYYMEEKSISDENDCYYYNPDRCYTNHAITIVGWDDSIDKNVFKRNISGVNYTPKGNGAWLVKNSYGVDDFYNNEGYFWLSYYDSGLLYTDSSKTNYNTAFALDFESVDNYDYNYQYDGTNSYILKGPMGAKTVYSANIFTVENSKQYLEAVGFYTTVPDMSYSVQIYKLDNNDSPIGEVLLSEIEDGCATYAGFHTVKLKNKVVLDEGEMFSVVITQSVNKNLYPDVDAKLLVDGSLNMYGYNYTSNVEKGQSFSSYNGIDWNDMYDDGAGAGNVRIKAYTNVLAEEDKVNTPINPLDNKSLPSVNVYYHTHIQTYGDSQETKQNGAMAGTSGESKRLENIWIDLSGNSNLGVQYSTHCQSYGWLPWSSDGEANGTSGEAKRLEAIKIQLTGDDRNRYDIYYRVHAQSYGWLGWAKNGAPSGTSGYGKRLEGIQIVVLKKGETSPSLNYAGVDGSKSKYSLRPYISADKETIKVPGNADAPIVSYKTHVQSYGWQNWVINGAMSGTSGKAKRLEGINIKVTNCPYDGDIVYTTHVQTYGWQGNPDDITRKGWKKNGEMSGTSGQAKRLEAICIDLTGEKAEHYDVYYRVHAQTFGWLGWAKNGEESGTAGYAKRLEGIQIVLVPKGGAAPGNNYGGITSKDTRAYISQ